MKIPFDIKYRPQIESGEYKVETRSGKTARIICWDRIGTQLVVLIGKDEDVLTYNPDGTTGQQMQLPSDLFIVTPEEELAEFENAFVRFLSMSQGEPPKGIEGFAKEHSKELLALAKKELQPEIDAEIEKAYRTQDDVVFRKGWKQGRADALRDLPRWKPAARAYDGDRLPRIDWLLKRLVAKFEEGIFYLDMNDLYKLPGFNEEEDYWRRVKHSV